MAYIIKIETYLLDLRDIQRLIIEKLDSSKIP